MLTSVKGIYESRKSGGLKGKVGLPTDFNEPLDDLKEYMF